ncbi:hypothetical protein CC80DRAFT_597456 [Byssothecium circinans]|uniref:DUF7820 domain-containing protein n=1 Tax=Byssothecium circinans TaxID=147558 RepID=A0A6A5TG20_9PLEO|nr:hypothetical protein CC80DRAFT_597456 [Byssothecium circinans]
MRLSRQSSPIIPVLPSIYTSFPVDSSPGSRNTPANETPSTEIEEGIELVPIERLNTTCGKILSPGTEDKEVIFSKRSPNTSTKRLPALPKNRWRKAPKSSWDRLSVKHRMLVLFAVQISILATITGCLLSVKGRNATSGKAIQPTDPGTLPPTPSIPIKQGTFAVALGNARQQSSACLARSNESAAWACTSDDVLQVSILPSTSQQPGQRLISIGSPSHVKWTSYGQRPLAIPTTTLIASQDPESPDDGLAYHFQTTYNRTVLIKDDQLPVSSMASGRMNMASPMIQEGDQPWVCFFNQTVVEGYIYVSRRAVSTNTSTSALSANSTTRTETPFLPYTFKLSEQRVSNSTIPYCERQTVSEHGELIPNGASKLLLALSEPAFILEGAKLHRYKERGKERRHQPLVGKSCQCQWVVE